MSTMAQHGELAGHVASSIHGKPPSARLAGCSRLIVATAEHVGATLLVLEILLLSAAVVARYGLSMPLVWSDELAEFIIIWQAMLGAVVAFHKGQHLSLTVLARNVSIKKQAFLENLGLLLTVLLCVPLACFAYAHALADFDLMTPALEISPAWRTGALVVGLGLIALLGCLALVQRARMTSDFVLAVALVLGVFCTLYFARNQFIGLGNANLLIFFVGLGGACMLAGVPIAFAFGLAATAYVLLATNAPLSIVPVRMEAGMAHILLLSVPLFIALGAMLDITGMARRMVEFLAAMVGHVKGGLSYVLVGGMVLVSGISGSKAADMAAIAPVLLPEMKRRGAKDGDMIALLAGSSAASETIPPSLILIMTGAVTGVSIGALFTAGWLPAIVLSLMICVLARLRAGRSESVRMERASWKTARILAVSAAPVLILPFLIRSAVVEGVATATEVATIGLAYVLVVTLVLQRSFDWRRFYGALKDASTLTGAIFIILAMANAMAWGFVQSGLSTVLSGIAHTLPGGTFGFLIVSIFLFVVLGSVLEGIPAIVLLGPLLFPVAKAMGISEVHYAIVAVMAMGVGLFAPPFGVGFYTACAIGRVSPVDAMKAIWPYLGVVVVGVILVAFIPWLTTGFLK
jgi:tripartite ATP-independent transporter DctM subunit